MAEGKAQGSGSLALADELKIKPLPEGKRDSAKESLLSVTKNAAGPFNLEAAIKNVDKMSSELKKLNGNSAFPVQSDKKLLRALL